MDNDDYNLATDLILRYLDNHHGDPAEIQIRLKLCECFAALGRYNEVLPELNKCIEIAPSDATLYGFRGDFYKMRHKWEEAAEDYTTFLHYGSTSEFIPEALGQRAQCYQQLKRYVESIQDATEAIEMGDVLSYATRGMCHVELKQWANAVNDLQLYLNERPTDRQFVSVLSHAYANLHNFEQELGLWNEYLKLVPNDHYGLSQRGGFYLKHRKIEEAMKDFEASIRIKPLQSIAWKGLAECHLKQEKYRDAIKDFSQAIEFQANDESCIYSRGVCYEYVGEKDLALKDYQRVLDLNPNHQMAQTRLKSIKGILKVVKRTHYIENNANSKGLIPKEDHSKTEGWMFVVGAAMYVLYKVNYSTFKAQFMWEHGGSTGHDKTAANVI
jgi:tetratricopeptide (TPR) repeat protein